MTDWTSQHDALTDAIARNDSRDKGRALQTPRSSRTAQLIEELRLQQARNHYDALPWFKRWFRGRP